MRIGLAFLLAFILLVVLIPLSVLRSPPVSRPVESPSHITQEVQGEASSAPVTTTRPVADAESFAIYNTATSKVETVSVQDYVRGAVAAEMPPSFHLEALKAQAVAAHTYALYRQNLSRLSPDPVIQNADFSADPDHGKGYMTEEMARERYGDQFELYWSKICEAADSTLGYVLTYDGQPILAAYHSTSNGETEDAVNVWSASVPYLVPVESEGDLLAPDFATTETFTPKEVRALFSTAYPSHTFPASQEDWFVVKERSDSGYVTQIQVGDQILHGKEVRQVLGLKSSDFTVSFQNGTFAFQVEGYGHGVGLSQYGADYMARQGATFDEILTHYFTGAKLSAAQSEEQP